MRAISKAEDTLDCADSSESVKALKKTPARKPATGKISKSKEQAAKTEPDRLSIENSKPFLAPANRTKALSLGPRPQIPRGENCNIRDVIKASELAQSEEFAVTLATTLGGVRDQAVTVATETLRNLQVKCGDDTD